MPRDEPYDFCEDCGERIIWVQMVTSEGRRGERMPLDYEADHHALVRFGPGGSSCRMVRTWSSHRMTCKKSLAQSE